MRALSSSVATLFTHLALAATLLLPASGVSAQPSMPASAPPATPAETPADQTAAAGDTAAAAEPAAPESPREALRAFFAAARSGRWADAARYLVVPAAQQDRAAELAERLKGVIDAGNWIDLETVSGDANGVLNDGLPPELEAVGDVTVGGRDDPLRLTKVTEPEGVHWAFSPNTVANIDTWYGALPDRWVRDTLVDLGADALLRPGPFELLWWQWLAVVLLIGVAWLAGRLLSAALRLLLHRWAERRPGGTGIRLAKAIGPPATLLGTLLVFALGVGLLVLTDPAVKFVATIVAAGVVVALFWGLWRSVDVVLVSVLQSPRAMQNASTRSLLSVGSNLVKGGIVVCGALAVLGTLGYPVATVLAGLGIGGLALAFGAQKTIENLFGSIALAVDQPMRVGDFVRVEDFVGTVEDIGLRSTRFRTLDRTVISIPNGKLADQRLESFQVRDRMRLATTIGVTYDTTADQMREILAGLEQVLRDHPRIWPDAMVVKFKEFGASSLDIEVMAWFAVPTWGDFQVCREEVLLGFMGVVEQAGSSFAFPTRTVHLVQDGPQE